MVVYAHIQAVAPQTRSVLDHYNNMPGLSDTPNTGTVTGNFNLGYRPVAADHGPGRQSNRYVGRIGGRGCRYHCHKKHIHNGGKY
jgi:hypothetical protein